jgi:hypothetical protein
LLALVYALLSLFTGVLNDLAGVSLFISVTVYVLAHIAVVASTAYRANALLAGAALIDGVNDKRHAQAVSLRELSSRAQGLLKLADKLPGSVRREAGILIGKVADALKYSDPVVPDKLAGINEGIASGIDRMEHGLERAIADKSEDLTELREAADGLQGAIQDRNGKVRSAK